MLLIGEEKTPIVRPQNLRAMVPSLRYMRHDRGNNCICNYKAQLTVSKWVPPYLKITHINDNLRLRMQEKQYSTSFFGKKNDLY